ncbi:MAG: 30S ribosomal protein S12 methylthiotransferase RimO [Gammaproteobacteria bacterium]
MTGKVGFVSLGCPKALVDSEAILTRLTADGYRTVDDYADADIVVINTCGFIDSAVAESIETIEEALGSNGRVVVTGCLGADAARLQTRFPNLLSVSGPQATDAVVAAVHQHAPMSTDTLRPADRLDIERLMGPAGVKLTPPHYAYLKISEGCNHTCSFCIIPDMRGKLRSRRIDDVLAEADRLASAGVQELLVIAQDTSAYGVDLRYAEGSRGGRPLRTDLETLCRELGQIVPWVRLHYVYPYPHVDALLPLMAQGLVLPYLDIPLQHADPAILKAMRRPAAVENTLRRLASWRAICPDITVRSTFIVGFPGETDAAFGTLLDFLDEAQLDRVGCFTYSDVEGARANQLPDHVEERVKLDRHEQVMELQATISAEKLARKVGGRIEVMIDQVKGDRAEARSRGDAPEIDGLVKVTGARRLRPGDRVWVDITDSDDHDLHGRYAAQTITVR